MSQKDKARAGDLVFFAALMFFVALLIGMLKALPLTFTIEYPTRVIIFLSSAFLGLLFATVFIRGYLSVFLHEFKHAIAAILAGNSPRGIKIGKESGHFEYAFSEDARSYNAFIYLAPYTVPLCSVMLILISIYPLYENMNAMIAISGFGYGLDLTISLRDVHPKQTDFSNLYGGFGIGILYVVALHLIFAISVISLVSGGIAPTQDLYTSAFKFLLPVSHTSY